jgi:hypothetical protein
VSPPGDRDSGIATGRPASLVLGGNTRTASAATGASTWKFTDPSSGAYPPVTNTLPHVKNPPVQVLTSFHFENQIPPMVRVLIGLFRRRAGSR